MPINRYITVGKCNSGVSSGGNIGSSSWMRRMQKTQKVREIRCSRGRRSEMKSKRKAMLLSVLMAAVFGVCNLGGVARLNFVSKAAGTLTSIAVTTAPTKTVYTEGETFDSTGMVVTATYNNDPSNTEVVTGYTCSPSAELKTSDTTIIFDIN